MNPEQMKVEVQKAIGARSCDSDSSCMAGFFNGEVSVQLTGANHKGWVPVVKLHASLMNQGMTAGQWDYVAGCMLYRKSVLERMVPNVQSN